MRGDVLSGAETLVSAHSVFRRSMDDNVRINAWRSIRGAEGC